MTSKMRIIHLFLLIIFILSFSEQSHSETKKPSLTQDEKAWLDKKHTVRVRVGDAPPWEINTPEPQGMTVDYLSIIGQQFGIDFKFLSGHEAWIDGFKDMADKQLHYDLLPAAKRTKERLELYSMSDDYLSSPWVIFSRKDTMDIYSLEDLHGRKVAVERGYVMHQELAKIEPQIELVIRESTQEALIALSTMKADAYVGNLIVTSYLIRRHGFTNIKVACPTPFGEHNQAMVTHKGWAPLISIINKGLSSISHEEKSKIQNKYVGVRFEHGIRSKDVFKWVLITAGILTSILLVILFWNRKLNKEIDERKKVEQRLRESENKYRSLSDAAFEGIIITDKGRILDVNNVVAQISGYSTTELIGMNSIALVCPEDRDEVQNKIVTGYDKPYEICGLAKDGTTYPLEAHAKSALHEGREVRITAIRDLTEKKKADDEIKILRGILPICSICKNIRNDKGYYEQIEAYIHKHTGVDFSHTICHPCMEKHYPKEYESFVLKKKNNT